MRTSNPIKRDTDPTAAERRPANRIASVLPALFAFIAIAIAIVWVYWPGLRGGFVFDDYSNIVFNSALHVIQPSWSNWLAAAYSSPASDLQRPLAMLSFALNYFFTGLDPWPMKLTNVLIHVLNAGLVLALVRSLLQGTLRESSSGFRSRLALFACSCWALMPINLMAVLLIVQRMESLSHVFVFLGLWLYVVGRLRQLEGRNGWTFILPGLVLCTALGALAKESAVLLPLYAFCIELCIFGFRRSDGSRDRNLMTLYLGVLWIPAVIGVAWMLPASLDPAPWRLRNFNLAERLMTEPRVVADYLQWTLAPDLNQLGLFHDDYPITRSFWASLPTVFASGLLLATLALAWFFRTTRPLSSLGLAWFFSAQLLTATFLPLEIMFEHRNYFASLGIGLVLTDLLLVWPRRESARRILAIVAGFLLVYYGMSTRIRAVEWSDPVRFAQTEATKHPQSPRATYHLAQTYVILSDGKKSSPFTPAAFAAFERASEVPYSSIAPMQGALILAARTGTPFQRKWWEDIQAKLRDNPIGPQELGALGAMTDCTLAGRCAFPPDEMMASFAAALSRGDNPEVLSIYGNYALNILADPLLAERLWREAHRIRPAEPQYVISLAKLMISQQRMDEARDHIQTLRSMGRLGQYESAAQGLEVRLEAGSRPGPSHK